MKKVYKRPIAEIVVLNLGEPVAWGEGANASNTGTHTEAKEQSFEEDDATDKLNIQFKDIWEDEE